jgi:hypothetical protein
MQCVVIRATDLRAKSGIRDTENAGDIGNAWYMLGAASARHGKLSDSAGMKYDLSVKLPKLDVTGSIPVARSKFLT